MKERDRPTSKKDPAAGQLRETLTAFQMRNGRLSDDIIDQALGLPMLGDAQEVIGTRWDVVLPDGRIERLAYQGSPYRAIREILDWVEPTEEDVIYDLGCGYGRFCLYGALTSRATYKGIELVESRIQVAEKAKQKLQIDNVTFIHGNVVDQDISDGTVFYIYNSFASDSLTEVIDILGAISEQKPIRVASYWTWNCEYGEQPDWLETTHSSERYYDLYLLKSKQTT